MADKQPDMRVTEMNASNTKPTGRILHDVSNDRASNPKDNAAPSYDGASVIQQVMQSATAEGKRQATLTMYLYTARNAKDERLYSREVLTNLFKQEAKDRGEWIKNTLRSISTVYAEAFALVRDLGDLKKKARSDLKRVQLEREADDAKRALAAAYGMMMNALLGCAALIERDPIKLEMDPKHGVFEITRFSFDEHGKPVMTKPDASASPEEMAAFQPEHATEFETLKGRELVSAGRTAIERWIGKTTNRVTPNAANTNTGTTPGAAASTGASVLNKAVFQSARSALDIVATTKEAIAPELATERDALLMTLIRTMFGTDKGINVKALEAWIVAHNKATASNGVSVAATSSAKPDTKGEPAKEGSKTNQPRTARGS